MGKRVAVMGLPEAFGYGFASFFSIWQACLLQISPFFLAFVIGHYFAGYSDRERRGFARRAVYPSAMFAAGFSLFQALSSVTGLPIGRFLSYYGGALSFVSGAYILLVGLHIVLSGRVRLISGNPPLLVSGGASVLLGSPLPLCIRRA